MGRKLSRLWTMRTPWMNKMMKLKCLWRGYFLANTRWVYLKWIYRKKAHQGLSRDRPVFGWLKNPIHPMNQPQRPLLKLLIQWLPLVNESRNCFENFKKGNDLMTIVLKPPQIRFWMVCVMHKLNSPSKQKTKCLISSFEVISQQWWWRWTSILIQSCHTHR